MTKKDDNKPAEKKKGSVLKKILIWGFVAGTLIGGSAAAALFLTGGLDRFLAGADQVAGSGEPTDDNKPPAPKVNANPPQYVSLDPPFVVNFSDEGLLRYLQISVSLMTRDKEIVDAAVNNMPHIRNNLILLFGGQNFETLDSTEGKEKLRAAALAEIQGIMSKETGSPGIEAVYFTNFVMQ